MNFFRQLFRSRAERVSLQSNSLRRTTRLSVFVLSCVSGLGILASFALVIGVSEQAVRLDASDNVPSLGDVPTQLAAYIAPIEATGEALFAPDSAQEDGENGDKLVAQLETGKSIYAKMCASCHGENGEGQTDDYEDPLYGDRSLHELTRIIAETMPEGDEEACVADDATAVAQFMYETFYTEAARAAHRPPRVELMRLTVRQYQQSLADLFATFLGKERREGEPGLSAIYYASRGFSNDKKKIERVDAQIDFDFGAGSPDPDSIDPKEFSMRWRGSILIEQTGEYEFIVSSQNGVRFWLNSSEQLIDGWVNSGETVTEHRVKLFLLEGRAYPIRLEYFSFEDETASLKLEWITPHGRREVVPSGVLLSDSTAEVYVAATAFPPDDRSTGYERGTAISPRWDEATTAGAIAAANQVVDSLDRFARTNANDESRREKVIEFALRFVERAFRRPLTDLEKDLYVRRHFDGELPLEESAKRVVLLTLKSPHFLYLGLDVEENPSYGVASRISYAIWDSLPDEGLLNAARANRLSTRPQVEAQVARMLNDPRTKSKVRRFFTHWLPMDEADEVSKDIDLYPGFDEQMVVDLRRSLELFLTQVMWSEPSDYRELLLADYMYMTPRMAEFYEVDYLPKDEPGAIGFQRIQVDGTQRAGVITHPLLMSVLAKHRSSSPIHRGVFITRNVLSRSLNPPPEAIEFEEDGFDATLTMREKVAQLTEPAACQTCHRIINPLGFSLENYDAVGRYRQKEQEREIDSTAVYETAEGDSIKLEGARDLAEFAAGRLEAHEGFVEALFQQTVKQSPYAFGPSTLEALTERFRQNDFNMQRLLADIVATAACHDFDPSNQVGMHEQTQAMETASE